MPRIGKLLGTISAARERHRERHRPTGFGFALADRIDYANAPAWDSVVATSSFFLGRPFESLPIYHRLLHALVADAIEMRTRRLSLGRTALDAKARLGARPVPTHVWLRHRLPAANAIVRSFLWAVPHDEAPDRSPFKP